MTDETKNEKLQNDLLLQKTSNLCALTYLIGGEDFAELNPENQSSIMQVMTTLAIDVNQLVKSVFPQDDF